MNRLFSAGFARFYALLGSIALLSHAQQAHTCTPMPPGVHDSTPDTGSDLPSNSAVVFNIRNMVAEDFTATLDGATIDLEAVNAINDNFNFSSTYYLALRPQIQPSVGQELVIEGCYQDTCTQFTFNITEADNGLPALPSSWSFSMHDFEDFLGNGAACQGSSSLAYFLDFFGTSPAGTGEATNYYLVKAFLATDTDGDTPLLQRVIKPYGATATTSFRINPGQINDADPNTGLCFQVQAFDAAENTSSGVSTQCLPCYSLTDPPAQDNGNSGPGGPANNWMSQPAEPEWAEGHLYAGGTCSTEDPCDYITCDPELECFAPNQTVMSSYGACIDPPGDGGVEGDPCDQISCPENTHCVPGEDTVLTVPDHCIVDDPVICDLECQAGYVCELQEVTCITSPCPPQEICVLDGSTADAGVSSIDAGVSIADAGMAIADAGMTPPESVVDAGTIANPPETTVDAGSAALGSGMDAGNPPLEFVPNAEDASGGCSCSAAQQRTNASTWWSVGLLTILFVLHRQRRRPKLL